MPTLPIYRQDGTKSGTRDVPASVFDVPMNTALLHRVITVAAKNARISTAHTKRRGEVSGGGRKPWKQKGTGRARAGSIRSPLWRGGGTTFGPRAERVYQGKANRKERQAAMRIVLSDLVRDGRFVLVDSLDLAEPKTKLLVTSLAKLPSEGSILLVTADRDDSILRAGRNVRSLSIAHVSMLSPAAVLSHGSCVMTVGALDALLERLGANAESGSAKGRKSRKPARSRAGTRKKASAAATA